MLIYQRDAISTYSTIASTIAFTCEFVAKVLSIFGTDNPELILLDKHGVSYRRNPAMAAIVYPRYSNRI